MQVGMFSAGGLVKALQRTLRLLSRWIYELEARMCCLSIISGFKKTGEARTAKDKNNGKRQIQGFFASLRMTTSKGRMPDP
jgi:hypothetical protein